VVSSTYPKRRNVSLGAQCHAARGVPAYRGWVGTGLGERVLIIFLWRCCRSRSTLTQRVRTSDPACSRSHRAWAPAELAAVEPSSWRSVTSVAGLRLAIGRGLIGVVVGRNITVRPWASVHDQSRRSAAFRPNKVFAACSHRRRGAMVEIDDSGSSAGSMSGVHRPDSKHHAAKLEARTLRSNIFRPPHPIPDGGARWASTEIMTAHSCRIVGHVRLRQDQCSIGGSTA